MVQGDEPAGRGHGCVMGVSSAQGIRQLMQSLFCSKNIGKESRMVEETLALGELRGSRLATSMGTENAAATAMGDCIQYSPDPVPRCHGTSAFQKRSGGGNTAIRLPREHFLIHPDLQILSSPGAAGRPAASPCHAPRVPARPGRSASGRDQCNAGFMLHPQGGMDGAERLDGYIRQKQYLQQEQDECHAMIKRIQELKIQLMSEMEALQQALNSAYGRRRENEQLLMLHEALQGARDLESAVRSVKQAALDGIPEDLRVMITDCLESRHGMNTDKCVVCMEIFNADDLLEIEKSERCRHAIYPCGHAVLCGVCSKHIWETSKRCPLCRASMTKKPKVFRPGRWQMIER